MVEAAPTERPTLALASRTASPSATSACTLQTRRGCLVSVITPFCQRIDATLNALASIAQQTHPNWEHILIMDDARGPLRATARNNN